MNNRLISTRTTFLLVSFITLVLIIGSSVLSRIVFKAAVADATLYFSQPTINTRPNTTFTMNVLADPSAAIGPSGVQLEIDFDPNILQPVSQEPAVLWKKVLTKTGAGKLILVMVPIETESSSETAGQGLNLAQLTFRALAEGTTTLTLNPELTILAVSGISGSKEAVNIVSSVIDSQIHITNEAPDPPINNPTQVDSATTQEPLEFSSQRIISTSSVLTPNSALILVRLEHQSRVAVAFGQTPMLGNRAEYSTKSDQVAIRIVGLEPNIRYYYQVIAEGADATNRIKGQIKSFELPRKSTTNLVDRSELTVFPARATQSATAYAVFFDQENNIISGLEPQLQSDNSQVSTTSFSEMAGLYQASVESLNNKKQVVRYTLKLGDRTLSNYAAIFDPTLGQTKTPTSQSPLAILLDQKTINLILILVASLIVLGLGFYKLARAK